MNNNNNIQVNNNKFTAHIKQNNDFLEKKWETLCCCSKLMNKNEFKEHQRCDAQILKCERDRKQQQTNCEYKNYFRFKV